MPPLLNLYTCVVFISIISELFYCFANAENVCLEMNDTADSDNDATTILLIAKTAAKQSKQ